MDNEHKYRDLFQIAVQIGNDNASRAIGLANENKEIRKAIWLALGQLRRGQIDGARRTLERQIHRIDIE
jgi:hypothetical protein